MARRLHPQMVGAVLDVLDDHGMNIALARPFQPITVRDLQMHVNHPVDQSRRHWLHDGIVLSPIARADHDRAHWQFVLADSSLMDETVKRFLDFLRASVQFVQEQAVWMLTRNGYRWAKPAATIDYLRNTDQIFRGKLAAQ